MKQLLLALSLLAAILSAQGQAYTFNRVRGSLLDIPFADTSLRTINRSGSWLYFDYNIRHFPDGGGGSQGFALKIIDSVWNNRENRLTYILDFHWITTFDSCYIGHDTVILYNHTLDFLKYTNK